MTNANRVHATREEIHYSLGVLWIVLAFTLLGSTRKRRGGCFGWRRSALVSATWYRRLAFPMARRACRIMLTVTPLVAWQIPATSQSLTPGARVRVTAPEAALNRQPGQLLWLDSDSLVFEGASLDLGARDPAPQRWVVPRDVITGLERSLGTRGHTARGLLIGTGLGLAIGLGVTDFGRSSSICAGSGDYGVLCALTIVAPTAGGAVLGALLGSAARTERWEAVPPLPGP